MFPNRSVARHLAGVALLILTVPLAACTHGHATVTRTETIECVEVRDEQGQPIERECETAHTRIERDPGGCHGVITCTGHVVGEVIALPFRITGAVLGVLF